MADTEQPELTLERFQALVEAYGGDIERFPTRERVAARELVARSEAAQRLLQAARAFDVVLREARADVTPDALLERLGEIPLRHAQRAQVVRLLPFHSSKQTWLLAAAAVLLGAIGGNYANGDAPTTDSSEIASLTFADDLFDDLTLQQEGDRP
jgi:hypothetical protein